MGYARTHFEMHSQREVWIRSILTCLLIALITTFTARAVFDELFPELTDSVRLWTAVFTFVITSVLAFPMLVGFGYMGLELSQANKKLAFLANRDPLTGLMNRRAFTEEFELRSREARQKRQNGIMMLIDADHFKSINDTYGHDGGDEALVFLARTLETASGQTAFVARLGGEEFVVCDFGADATRKAAERLCSAISAKPVNIAGKAVPVTASIGCHRFKAGADLAHVLRFADLGVYEAKAAGRNRVVEHHGDSAPSLEPDAGVILQRPKTKRARKPASTTSSS